MLASFSGRFPHTVPATQLWRNAQNHLQLCSFGLAISCCSLKGTTFGSRCSKFHFGDARLDSLACQHRIDATDVASLQPSVWHESDLWGPSLTGIPPKDKSARRQLQKIGAKTLTGVWQAMLLPPLCGQLEGRKTLPALVKKSARRQ